MYTANYNKVVLTHSAHPCHYPLPTLGAKLIIMVLAHGWQQRTTWSLYRPSPRCGVKEKWKEKGKTCVSG